MKHTQKIALYNNKGGVAKTTSVINLAYCIQKAGRKVLVVDCDTQENCYMFFMTDKRTNGILPTDYENIFHTTWTRYAELDADRISGFDYIMFDLPPAMTDEVKQIIRHSGLVYVPTMLGEFEIHGLERVTVEIARQQAQIGGIFITMYRRRNDEELLRDFRSALDSTLLQTIIPYSDTVRESQKAGLPLEAYFTEKKVPRSGSSWKIVNAYENLTDEILRRSEV
jgi:chromosome partitioning protein